MARWAVTLLVALVWQGLLAPSIRGQAPQGEGAPPAGAEGRETGLVSDPNLILRPGDRIEVRLVAGGISQTFQVMLDAQGEAVISLLGRVRLADLTVSQAGIHLTRLYRTYYREPVVAVRLVSPGSLTIYLVGTEGNLRQLRINSHTTLAQLMLGRGAGSGFVRRVVLVPRRVVQGLDLSGQDQYDPVALAGELAELSGVEEIDALVFLRTRVGKFPRFFSGGELVVLVPPAKRVEVVYGVRRSNADGQLSEAHAALGVGLEEGEGLREALNLVGLGRPEVTLAQVVVETPDPEGGWQREVFDLRPYLTEGGLLSDRLRVPLADGARIYLPNLDRRVLVLGGVESPGSYLYLPERTVFDYIALAGGYHQDASLRFIYLVHPKRLLGKDELDFEVETVDLVSAYKEGRPNFGPSVRPGDIIIVQVEGDKFTKNALANIITSLTTGLIVALR